MFNSEQEDWMRYLAGLPHERKCKCGWHPLGECPRCPFDSDSASPLTETDAQHSLDRDLNSTAAGGQAKG
jgi:hypothetical protein